MEPLETGLALTLFTAKAIANGAIAKVGGELYEAHVKPRFDALKQWLSPMLTEMLEKRASLPNREKAEVLEAEILEHLKPIEGKPEFQALLKALDEVTEDTTQSDRSGDNLFNRSKFVFDQKARTNSGNIEQTGMKFG